MPMVHLLTTRELADARSPALLYTTGRDRAQALAIPPALLNSEQNFGFSPVGAIVDCTALRGRD